MYKSCVDDIRSCKNLEPPYEFALELLDGFIFDTQSPITWKGSMNKMIATWTAPSVEIGLELFNYVRERILESRNTGVGALCPV